MLECDGIGSSGNDQSYIGKAMTQAARMIVAIDALDYQVDQTFTTLCPVCNGGATGEKKLRVTRAHDGALFICLRASCGFRGFAPIGQAGSQHSGTIITIKPARAFTGVTRPLTAERRAYLYADNAGIRLRGLLPNWVYATGEDDLVFPLRGFLGQLIGHQVRTKNLKADNYRMFPGTDSLYRYYSPENSQKSERIVLVEDCLSAIAVASHGFPAIALLGTNVGDTVMEFLQNKPDVAIWLDRDAFAKGVELAKQNSWTCITTRDDPKKCPNITEILQGDTWVHT